MDHKQSRAATVAVVGVVALIVVLVLVARDRGGDVPPPSSSSLPAAPGAATDAGAGVERAAGSAPVPEPDTDPVTADGAATAAAELVRVVQTLLYAPGDRVGPLVTSVTTADGAEVLGEVVDTELADVCEALATAPSATTWWVVQPLSVEVLDFDPAGATATVEMWVVQVFSRSGVSDPEARFRLQTLDLAHHDGRWLIDGWLDVTGPAARPSAISVPATAPELDRLLDGHRLVGVPNRVEGS